MLGFLAYGALVVSVLYGLLLSTGILDRVAHRAVSLTLHQDLSAIAIGLTALHGALLALDTYVPQSVRQLVMPFAGPYRPEWVGIGQVAFYLMVIVYGSFYVRRRIGQRALATAPLHDVARLRGRDRPRRHVGHRFTRRLGLLDLSDVHGRRRLPARLPHHDRRLPHRHARQPRKE